MSAFIHRVHTKDVDGCGDEATKACDATSERAKMSGPESATNTTPALTTENLIKRSEPMADTSQYPDSGTPSKPEQNESWKPIGYLARRLVEKAVSGE